MNATQASCLRKIWFVCLCVVILNLAGCGAGAAGSLNRGSDVKLDIYQATNLALKHLRDENAIASDYRLTCRQVDSEWVFWFEYLPAAPDNSVTLIVGADGSIKMGP